MRKFPVLILAVLISGCSPRDWDAKLHMVRAEDIITKAAELKSKKVPYEKRVALYHEACREFVRAYELDEKVYTLMRIESAIDTCWKAEDKLEEEKLTDFQERYIKAHPKEYEYGDTGPLVDMGG